MTNTTVSETRTAFKKTVRIGKRDKAGNIYLKIEFDGKRLSISGVEGPLANGDCRGGCGQIDMHYEHRNPDHNDKRNKFTLSDGREIDTTVKADSIDYAPGWDKEKWWDLMDVWREWHLNDMTAECEHQRALGWTYDANKDTRVEIHTPAKGIEGVIVTYTGKGECPTCGYRIGSQWLTVEVPDSVLGFLKGLPDSDTKPAWV